MALSRTFRARVLDAALIALGVSFLGAIISVATDSVLVLNAMGRLFVLAVAAILCLRPKDRFE